MPGTFLNLRRARSASRQETVERSRFHWRTPVSESTAGVLQRPAARTDALGTVLGVGAFVAVLGLTATAASQIAQPVHPTRRHRGHRPRRRPRPHRLRGARVSHDADQKTEASRKVEHAGVLWPVQLGKDQQVNSAP